MQIKASEVKAGSGQEDINIYNNMISVYHMSIIYGLLIKELKYPLQSFLC